MNIQALIERIDLFDELAVESGLIRDLAAYQTALSQPDTQSNLAALKDIAVKATEGISSAVDAGLHDGLNVLLPGESNFLDSDPSITLKALIDDPEVETPAFYNQLNTVINNVNRELKNDKTKIDNLRAIFSRYKNETDEDTSGSEKAVLALVLKELEATTSLQKFSRTLDRWNRTLLVYHQLLSSKSPEDVGLIGVHEGSIEVVFNVNIDIGINLAELMRLGFQVFAAYLLYKSKVHEIVLSYYGNKKLVEGEQQREVELLGNIRSSIEEEIKAQHKLALKSDKDINKESIPKKIEEVSKVLTGHIIRGNEVRLLSAGAVETPTEEDSEEETDKPSLARRLRQQTREANKLKSLLSDNEIKMLKEKFPTTDENGERK